MKIPAMKIASSLKSKIIKIKASGIVTLQKSSTLYQNYCQS